MDTRTMLVIIHEATYPTNYSGLRPDKPQIARSSHRKQCLGGHPKCIRSLIYSCDAIKSYKLTQLQNQREGLLRRISLLPL